MLIREEIFTTYWGLNSMKKPIQFEVGIVGLGWLGEALYQRLTARGIAVFGTRTSASSAEAMQKEGVNAFPLLMNPGPMDDSWEKWFRANDLIINIPPGRKDPKAVEAYPNKIAHLLQMARQNGVKRVLFVSSTSVFGVAKGIIDDDSPLTPQTDSGIALRECEERVMDAYGDSAAVVRFGGLYGPNRHPGRFFAGRRNVPDGDAPVNFIHQADAVGVIIHLLNQSSWGIKINACAPHHPPKKEFYVRAAKHLKLEEPTFALGGGDQKEIRCNFLKETRFGFQYPELTFE